MYTKKVYVRQSVERLNNYPFVLIHGFGGWGGDCLANKIAPYWGIKKSRDVIPMANELGFEVYNPSVGPITSNWDRACDLWAQLTGSTVDYGKAHSEKYNHNRFGRTYEKALIPDWGKLDTEGKRKKINLIGHSLGGPTTRILIELLANGSEEERAVTPESELSELFKGGKASWVHTETVLASCNGVSIASAFVSNEKLTNFAIDFFAWAALLTGETPFAKVIDFRLDHFGVSSTYNGGFKINVTPEKKKAIDKYKANRIDNVAYEMSVKYNHELTKGFKTFDNIYYFSYAACTTEPTEDGVTQRAIKGTNPFMGACANLEGHYINNDHGVNGPEWYASDGMVNLVSGKAPFDGISCEYESFDKIKPGIWQVMPVEQKHHMSYMGLGETASSYSIFYYEIMKRACNLPANED